MYVKQVKREDTNKQTKYEGNMILHRVNRGINLS